MSTRVELLGLHDTLTTELVELQRQYGYLLGQERHAKVEAHLNTQGSDKLRDINGSWSAIKITEEVFKVRADIDAHHAQLDNISLQLQYGGFTGG